MAFPVGSPEAKAWANSVHQRKAAQIIADLGPDNGFLSRASSPHLMWLADQLYRVCWLVPSACPRYAGDDRR